MLVVHVIAGLTCVLAGAGAALARKRPGWHPRFGRVYLGGLATVFVTATVLAVSRSRPDLFGIAVVTFGLGLFGWLARRRHRPGWVRRHAIGVGGSFAALLTGFYVDNGARLPLWDRLPHIAYWVLPSAVAIPLIWRALRRFSRPPRAAQPRVQPPA